MNTDERRIDKYNTTNILVALVDEFKGTQKGKVTCYARERVNKNKLF